MDKYPTDYWIYYHKLFAYKVPPSKEEAKRLEKEFLSKRMYLKDIIVEKKRKEVEEEQ